MNIFTPFIKVEIHSPLNKRSGNYFFILNHFRFLFIVWIYYQDIHHTMEKDLSVFAASIHPIGNWNSLAWWNGETRELSVVNIGLLGIRAVCECMRN